MAAQFHAKETGQTHLHGSRNSRRSLYIDIRLSIRTLVYTPLPRESTSYVFQRLVRSTVRSFLCFRCAELLFESVPNL